MEAKALPSIGEWYSADDYGSHHFASPTDASGPGGVHHLPYMQLPRYSSHQLESNACREPSYAGLRRPSIACSETSGYGGDSTHEGWSHFSTTPAQPRSSSPSQYARRLNPPTRSHRSHSITEENYARSRWQTLASGNVAFSRFDEEIDADRLISERTKPEMNRLYQDASTGFSHATDQQKYQLQDDVDKRILLTTEQRLEQPFLPGMGGHQQRAYEGVRRIGDRTYHVYEGGYYLPTEVEGVKVNPHWGLTKANLPRKRLSTACGRCRHKKTRCEPAQGGCLQCKKLDQACWP